jgi:hypothetical protein
MPGPARQSPNCFPRPGSAKRCSTPMRRKPMRLTLPVETIVRNGASPTSRRTSRLLRWLNRSNNQRDHAPLLPMPFRFGPRLGQLNFQDQHVPFGQVRDFNLITASCGCHGSDRLAVEDERENPSHLVHLQQQNLSTFVQRWAAEPTSQDKPPGLVGTPPNRKVQPSALAIGRLRRSTCPATAKADSVFGHDSQSSGAARRSVAPATLTATHPCQDTKAASVIASSFMAALVWSSLPELIIVRNSLKQSGVSRMMDSLNSSLTRRE